MFEVSAHAVNVYYFKAANSIDEFIGQVLEAKANMISAVVEGQAITQGQSAGDVLSELETVVQQLGANMDGPTTTSDRTDAAFESVIAGYAEALGIPVIAASDPLHKPAKVNTSTILALAKALSRQLP